MKAMILAAGLGTRLRPLTNERPKALVELSGRTLLDITVARLRSFGINEVIINVHHFADRVADYLKSKNNFGMRIEISREDDLLLDTGGGLKKASWFFLENSPQKISRQLEEPFLVHNVDVISTIDLSRMLHFHNENRALATLAVQHRDSSRYLLFNDHLQLSGRRIDGQDILVSHPGLIEKSSNGRHSERSEESAVSSNSPLTTRNSPLLRTGETSSLIPLAFSGIHILSPRLLPLLTESGVFSIIDAYLRLSSQSEKILAFRHDTSYWRDLGRPDDLAQAAHDLTQIGPLP